MIGFLDNSGIVIPLPLPLIALKFKDFPGVVSALFDFPYILFTFKAKKKSEVCSIIDSDFQNLVDRFSGQFWGL